MSIQRDHHDGYWDIEDETPRRIAEKKRQKENLRRHVISAFEGKDGNIQRLRARLAMRRLAANRRVRNY
jgi:hypothetical protein